VRSRIRTVVVVAAAVALVALFLRNVDLRRVGADIVRARPEWLALSLATMFANLGIRAIRWRYLLEPLGRTTFGESFRATAVGFAASSILPARAGEVIRPYFLARQLRHGGDRGVTATAAFATIIVERLLDVITVLVLLASYVFIFGRDLKAASPARFAALAWAGGTAAAASVTVLVVLFVVSGHPERLRRGAERFERVLPQKLAGAVARIVERFARGLAVIRRPGRLAVALAWSFPLWLSIAAGIWAAIVAFAIDVPFTGSFLILAVLVLGVAVPTPGAVGGFHAAIRYSVTAFFDADDAAAVGAAIVLHILSIGPSLLLGLVFAAQEGLDIGGMRRLADRNDAQLSTLNSQL
jgi:glycosyltransferase 2 family protein